MRLPPAAYGPQEACLTAVRYQCSQRQRPFRSVRLDYPPTVSPQPTAMSAVAIATTGTGENRCLGASIIGT